MLKKDESKDMVKYHLVWLTRSHFKILTSSIQSALKYLLIDILETTLGCNIMECNFDKTYVYLVVNIPSKYSVMKIVQQIKKITNAELIKQFTWLQGIWKDAEIWWPGYLRSTKAITEETIQEYIHKKQRKDERKNRYVDLND